MLISLADGKAHWSAWAWPNFSAEEFACRCGCGELWWDEAAFNGAQKVRTLLGRAVVFNSVHRCRKHNRIVGGAADSEHLKIAFDFSLRRPKVTAEEIQILQAVFVAAGFRTFGLYRNFIHVDRRWRKTGTLSEDGLYWIVGKGKNWQPFFKRFRRVRNHAAVVKEMENQK